MPEYPPLNGPEPRIFTDEDVSNWYQQLQNLAVTNAVIAKCERCNIPVEPSRRECDALCTFYHGLIDEDKQQSARSHLSV